MAHILNINLLDVLDFPDPQLFILHNEATRQRVLDAQFLGISQNLKASRSFIDKTMKIHGPYTEGFYERELLGLKEHLMGKGGK